MTKYMVTKLQGRLDCNVCGLVKAREKVVTKVINRRSTKSVERVYIDTTWPYYTTTGVIGYCICTIDDLLDMS